MFWLNILINDCFDFAIHLLGYVLTSILFHQVVFCVFVYYNEYTNAQVGDTGGLFKSLDPALCGVVPAYFIQCPSSNLPCPMLQFQSTSSSAAVPVYLIIYSAPVLCSLPHHNVSFIFIKILLCAVLVNVIHLVLFSFTKD